MEIKSKKQIANMDIGAKRAYLAELEQYREQLVATKSLREQGSGLKRAAETMMKYNPTGAFDLMDKSAQTEIERKRVEQLGMNKSRVVQLEQLWKDADRSLRQAKVDRDQPSITKYTELKNSLESQLRQLAPDTWGANPSVDDPKKDPDEKGDVEKAVTEGKTIVEGAKDVAPRNGVIDDYDKRKLAIQGLVKKYNISDPDIKEVYDYLESKAKLISDDFNAFENADQKAYERNKATLDNKIDGWKSDVTAWKEIRRKAISAISNYRNHNFGGSQTITMKALLGDALSEQERSVMAGKGYGSSVFGGIWTKLTNSATPVSKEDAEKVLRGLVDFVNSLASDFGSFKNNKYVLDGLGLTRENMNPLSFNSKNTEDGLRTGKQTGSSNDLDKALGL